MKKIVYHQIFRTKGGGGLDRHYPLPYKPFPGSVPLRWNTTTQFGDQIYNGKPSSQAYGQMIKHAKITGEACYLNIIDRVQKIVQFAVYANGEIETVTAVARLMAIIMPEAKTYNAYAETVRKQYGV